MNKEQFLRTLEESLKSISVDERKDIIEDIKEHFIMGLSEGKTEEEISEALGSPQQIAVEILTNHYTIEEKSEKNNNQSRMVWATIGLGFFNLMIVLGPVLGVFGLLLGGWVTGVTFMATPLLVVIVSLIFPVDFVLFNIFFSIALLGLGIFILLGMQPLTRGAWNLLRRYIDFNVKIIKGE